MMTKKNKEIIPETGHVVEPDEIILSDYGRFRDQNERIVFNKSGVRGVSIIPGIAVALIGTVIGAVFGGLLGLLAGPVGLIGGIVAGALSGLIVGLAIGMIGWIMLPKPVRILILMGSIFAILNWVAVKFFHFSLFEKINLKSWFYH